MQRASVALAVDGGCLLFDPVDAEGLDEALAGVGTVLGVCSPARPPRPRRSRPGRAPRRAARRAHRARRDAGVRRLEPRAVYRARRWHETAVWLEERRLLIVAESLGTIPFFLTRPGDRLGMHPLARIGPPRSASRGSTPTRSPSGTAARDRRRGLALARAQRRARLEIPRALPTTFSASRRSAQPGSRAATASASARSFSSWPECPLTSS